MSDESKQSAQRRRSGFFALVPCTAALAPGGPRAEPAKLPGHWWRGHRGEFDRDPMGLVLRASRLGPVVLLRLRRPTCLLGHIDDVRHVLLINRENYVKNGFIAGWKRFFGRGLLTAETPDHTPQRRLINPLYRAGTVERWLPFVARSLDEVSAQWTDGQEVNIAEQLLRVFRRLAVRSVLGLDDPAVADVLYGLIVQAHRAAVTMHRCPVRIPDGLPRWAARLHRKTMAELDGQLGEIVRVRRAAGDWRDGAEDVLGHLLLTRQREPSAVDEALILDHLRTLLAATTEETNTPTAFGAWRLAEQAAWADRLAAEARQGQARPRAVMFWRETVRLHPPLWLMRRRTLKADVLPGGLRLAAGASVAISPWAMHHNPECFPDPERFNPERFTAEAMAQRPAGAYFPFGLGARQCLGAALSECIGAATLSMLARDWRLEVVAGQEPALQSPNQQLAHPARGRVVVRVKRRESAPAVEARVLAAAAV